MRFSHEKHLCADPFLNRRAFRRLWHTIFDGPHSPERGKGDGLWPFVSPFSLLLSEDEELGLDDEALFENGRVLQSVKNNIYF